MGKYEVMIGLEKIGWPKETQPGPIVLLSPMVMRPGQDFFFFNFSVMFAENRGRVTCLFRTQFPRQPGRFSPVFSAFEARNLSAI